MGNQCASIKSDFVINVKTGDIKGAGTDSNVYCTLLSEDGVLSRAMKLDCRWKDDFEKGNVDTFYVNTGQPSFGPIKEIEIWRDESGLNDDWYVEWINVKKAYPEKHEDNPDQVFPFHRWVSSDRHLKIRKYDCILPQFDPNKDQRKWELENKRKVYVLSRKAPGIPKQVETCPRDESFSNDYKWDIVQNKFSLLAQTKLTKLTSEEWKSLEDLGNIYRGKLNKPYGYFTWKDDVAFGRQRLQGCNPTVIRRCTEIPENFKVTEEMIAPLLGDMTLSEAMEKKRIYIVNYHRMDPIACTENRVMGRPMALFYCNKNGDLMPLAIQLFQKPADDNPVFLPTDPKYTWMLAKMYYNNADASYHQSCTHLGFTHLVMETICVNTHRQLSPSHPVFRLLAPHFLYLLAINSLALAKLVSPGGWIDRTMTSGASGLFEIVAECWKQWRMDVDGWLPNDLKERGVDDTEALPNYPYRDDALLLHKAILDYARDVIETHYDSPEKLLEDFEIQNWGKMLSDPVDGLGILGIPNDGHFADKEDLIRVVTSIIFISSVGHAASNFAQYDEYAFPPNYPAFLRGGPPTSKEPLTERDILNKIPVKDMTLSIMVVTKLLSDRGTNALGDFEVQYQFDPVGLKAVAKFREALKKLSVVVEERNKSREFPYPYLDPREVPNAISI